MTSQPPTNQKILADKGFAMDSFGHYLPQPSQPNPNPYTYSLEHNVSIHNTASELTRGLRY